jgi:hypothetical protein
MNHTAVSDGTLRWLLLVAVLGCATALCWHGTINGEAYVGLLAALTGGVIHASGAKQGSDATQTPPGDG